MLLCHWAHHNCKIQSCVGRLRQSTKLINNPPPPTPLQASLVARIPLRASRASKAASGWPSPGAVSRLSAACNGYRPTTASTRKTTPLPCMVTSPRAPSKTMWGSAQTSARTNPSFRQQRSQDTQVRDLWCLNFNKAIFLLAKSAFSYSAYIGKWDHFWLVLTTSKDMCTSWPWKPEAATQFCSFLECWLIVFLWKFPNSLSVMFAFLRGLQRNCYKSWARHCVLRKHAW